MLIRLADTPLPSMFGIPVSMSAAISGYRLTVARMTIIAQKNPCFEGLSQMEQTSLLKVRTL